MLHCLRAGAASVRMGNYCSRPGSFIIPSRKVTLRLAAHEPLSGWCFFLEVVYCSLHLLHGSCSRVLGVVVLKASAPASVAVAVERVQ